MGTASPKVTSAPQGEAKFTLPPAVLQASQRLMAEYQDIVARTSAFSREVGDVARGDPKALAALLHSFSATTGQVFRRWNLEILYLLSIEGRQRFSQIRSVVKGISGRSLSLKLDEMEGLGLLHRIVSDDSPPHVSYELTEGGRTLVRLSFPMVLHLNLDDRLATLLASGAKTTAKAK